MTYARLTPAGIESGAFAQLWPYTSATNQLKFAADEGYSLVATDRPYSAQTQALEACPVYFEAGVFYAVRVVPLSLSAVADAVTTIVQAQLDAFAQTRGYDSILSATTYASSSSAQFAADGKTALDARDITWKACYSILAEVQGGTRSMPTLEQFLASLPVLVWPL